MIYKNEKDLHWNDFHLDEKDENIQKERAFKIVKEYLYINTIYAPISIIVDQTGVPYRLIKQLVEEGRLDVVLDRSEESIELENQYKQKHNNVLNDLMRLQNNLDQNDRSSRNGGMHSYR